MGAVERLGRTSEPDQSVALHKSKLNVGAGGQLYEKASSRRERTRDALMRHSELSRDEAKPLMSRHTKKRKVLEEDAEEITEKRGKQRFYAIARANQPGKGGLKPVPSSLLRRHSDPGVATAARSADNSSRNKRRKSEQPAASSFAEAVQRASLHKATKKIIEMRKPKRK